MGLVYTLIIGLVIGILGQVFMGGGLGWVLSIILGLAGSFVGGFLFQILNIQIGGLAGQIAAGVIGACIVLFVCRKLKK